MSEKLINLNKEEVIQKYKELKNIKDVAIFYGVKNWEISSFFEIIGFEINHRQKYTCNDNFFSQDNEKSFYWAGFIAADANIEKNSNRIKIELKSTDKEHLEKFKNDITLNQDLKFVTRIDERPAFKTGVYHSCKLRFNSAQMKKDLNFRFNIHEAKSKNFIICNRILNHEFFKHFLRGVIDGDGGYDHEKNHGTIRLCGTPKCMEQIYDYCKNKLNFESSSWCIRDSDGLGLFNSKKLKDNQKLLHLMYDDATVWLDRKKEIVDKILNSKPRKIDFDKNYLNNLFIERSFSTKDYYNQLEISKILNVSVCTVRRRLLEYGLR